MGHVALSKLRRSARKIAVVVALAFASWAVVFWFGFLVSLAVRSAWAGR